MNRRRTSASTHKIDDSFPFTARFLRTLCTMWTINIISVNRRNKQRRKNRAMNFTTTVYITCALCHSQFLFSTLYLILIQPETFSTAKKKQKKERNKGIKRTRHVINNCLFLLHYSVWIYMYIFHFVYFIFI